MLASVDQLADQFSGQLPATTFGAVREHLETRRAATAGAVSGVGTDAISELGTVRVHIDDWKLRTGGWTALDDGLLRTYKRGRRALGDARSSRRAKDLHAWRKRVKDLWYHERLLAPPCGRTVRGHAKELDRLSDLLGDDHDLAVLRQELTDGHGSGPADVDAVFALLDHRRDELQTQAFALGDRVYAERPKAYRRRMRQSWEAGRALARAPHEQHPADLAAATREPHPS